MENQNNASQPIAPVSGFFTTYETLQPPIAGSVPRGLLQSGAGDPYAFSTSNLERPSVCGGEVFYKRYRYTIEEVQEPYEVITGRLQFLWETSTNLADTIPLQVEARKLGYALRGNRGDAHKGLYRGNR